MAVRLRSVVSLRIVARVRARVRVRVRVRVRRVAKLSVGVPVQVMV